MLSSDATQASTPSTTQETNYRRKSGRVIRKPDLFTEAGRESSPLSTGSAKRKRQPNGHALLERGDEGSTDDDSTNESSASADPEELKEQKRQTRKRTATTKPATKRPRISNHTGTTLAIRPANATSKTASQKSKVRNARSRQSQLNQEGLYAEVFGRGQSGEDAAALWLQQYQQNNVEAMCEMVNFVLRCTGCEAKVASHDIEDVDNATDRLSDLQTEYQETPIVDYPLISKQKDYAAFRPVLVEFFSAFIKTIHNSSSLYEDGPLFENVQIWVDTMSSAGIRPFRHTATLISLTMSSALCQIARDLENGISLSRRQAEAESKKKKVNQARVKSIRQKAAAEEEKLAKIESILKDEFDVVFVHRYRDVDPKIRVECVAALGTWILTYRKMFLEGQYLRYLGWVLSDTVAQTRSEVVKQLRLLFKNPANIGSLRGFTDRFRPRMVEIAARDAEPGVRADTVELLDKLRDAELLEPDDIDTIGQLIFDSEPRVRKAVGKFFVANLEDLYKVNIESIDHDQLDSVLPPHPDSEDYMSPSRSWINFKCVAESLRAYHKSDQEDHGGRSARMLIAANMESRYMLATQAIFPHMDQLQEWESLAGYLLYDHSSIMSAPDDDDPASAVRGIYKMDEGEDSILLEVLDCAVKLYLVQIMDTQSEGKKKGRKTQTDKDHIQEKRETAARRLTVIVPQLLNKYGSVPQAASSILRLQQLLDVGLINELQATDSTYSTLLDDINKQFMTHSDRAVLAEASVALLKSKVSEPAKEATDAKVQDMWEDMLSTLQTLCGDQNLEARGTLPNSLLTEISNVMSRLSNLASISDCTLILETTLPLSITSKGRGSQDRPSVPLGLLFQLCSRGKPDEEVEDEVNALEDDLVMSVIKTLLFYFMWKVQSLRASVSGNTVRHLEGSPGILADLASRRERFSEVLSEVAGSRLPLDRLRFLSLSTSIDLHILFSTLRHIRPAKESHHFHSTLRSNLDDLASPIPAISQSHIMHTHDKLERSFAKKSRRKLASSSDPANEQHRQQQREPADDDLPIGSDSDDSEGGEAEDDHDDDGSLDEALLGHGRDARKAAVLLAEQHLCEFTGKLVLAVLAEVMAVSPAVAEDDMTKVKERLQRNKLRLGPNYKEVLAYLQQDPKEKRRKRPAATTMAAAAGAESGRQAVMKTSKDHSRAGGGGGGSLGKGGNSSKMRKSEPMVLSDDDIEDDEDADEQMQGQDEDEDQLEDLDDIDEEVVIQKTGDGGLARPAAPTDVDDDEGDEEQEEVMGD